MPNAFAACGFPMKWETTHMHHDGVTAELTMANKDAVPPGVTIQLQFDIPVIVERLFHATESAGRAGQPSKVHTVVLPDQEPFVGGGPNTDSLMFHMLYPEGTDFGAGQRDALKFHLPDPRYMCRLPERPPPPPPSPKPSPPPPPHPKPPPPPPPNPKPPPPSRSKPPPPLARSPLASPPPVTYTYSYARPPPPPVATLLSSVVAMVPQDAGTRLMLAASLAVVVIGALLLLSLLCRRCRRKAGDAPPKLEVDYSTDPDEEFDYPPPTDELDPRAITLADADHDEEDGETALQAAERVEAARRRAAERQARSTLKVHVEVGGDIATVKMKTRGLRSYDALCDAIVLAVSTKGFGLQQLAEMEIQYEDGGGEMTAVTDASDVRKVVSAARALFISRRSKRASGRGDRQPRSLTMGAEAATETADAVAA